MRLLFIIAILLVLASQQVSAQLVGSKSLLNTDTLDVQVRLVDKLDTILLPAYCGITMFNMTLNYQVIKVLNGTYNPQTISINHNCPRELVENGQVQNGRTYIYKLKRRKLFNEIVGQKSQTIDTGKFDIISFF